MAPPRKKDAEKYPFVALPYNEKMQRLHGMFGNISRVDYARHNEATKVPRCNWFDPEEKYLTHVHLLPTYGRSYMYMFMKMVKCWGSFGKRIRRVKTDEMVDQFCDEETLM